jgi:hypothetical protein
VTKAKLARSEARRRFSTKGSLVWSDGNLDDLASDRVFRKHRPLHLVIEARCATNSGLMLAVLLLASTLGAAAGAGPPRAVREPNVHVTPAWLAAQLLPSPAVGWGSSGAHLVLGWQVTPVLYAFWLDPRLSGWRWFVVEPLVRHSGSVELFVGPEYRSLPAEHLDGRVGLRSTFALLERGEVLSLSLATAYQQAAEVHSPSYEVGLHTLFGFLGLALGYAPADPARRWTAGLRLRVF